MLMALPSFGQLFAKLPTAIASEVFESLVTSPTVQIERIISWGHTSPATGWYDQAWQEWVMVLQGEAVVEWVEAEAQIGDAGDTAIAVQSQRLQPGDYLLLPAHCRHRVAWTTPEQPTIWLAVHFGDRLPPSDPGAII